MPVSAPQRSTATPHGPQDLLTTAGAAELARALAIDDERRALLAAETLWNSTGSLSEVYRVLSEQLGDAGRCWADGTSTLAHVQRMTVSALRLVARLRPLPPPAPRGTVVLACPPGDLHTLGLYAVAHLVEDLGYRAVLAGSLPWPDLAEVAAGAGDLVALGLSLHTDLPAPALRRGLALVRRESGHPPLLLGGARLAKDPGLTRLLGAHAAEQGGHESLDLLAGWTGHLSQRERQVLECVSTGMTNVEVARHLGLGAATVKSHLDHIFAKTGTTHRAAAVATALRRGWVN